MKPVGRSDDQIDAVRLVQDALDERPNQNLPLNAARLRSDQRELQVDAAHESIEPLEVTAPNRVRELADQLGGVVAEPEAVRVQQPGVAFGVQLVFWIRTSANGQDRSRS